MKGSLVLGWFFGTLGGLLIGGAALYGGLADEPGSHLVAWLVVGIASLLVGIASGLTLALGSRTLTSRSMAVLAIGNTLALTLLAIKS